LLKRKIIILYYLRIFIGILNIGIPKNYLSSYHIEKGLFKLSSS